MAIQNKNLHQRKKKMIRSDRESFSFFVYAEIAANETVEEVTMVKIEQLLCHELR